MCSSDLVGIIGVGYVALSKKRHRQAGYHSESQKSLMRQKGFHRFKKELSWFCWEDTKLPLFKRETFPYLPVFVSQSLASPPQSLGSADGAARAVTIINWPPA